MFVINKNISYDTFFLPYANNLSFLPKFIAGNRPCVSLPQRIVVSFMLGTHSRAGQGSLVGLLDPNIAMTIIQIAVADQR